MWGVSGSGQAGEGGGGREWYHFLGHHRRVVLRCTWLRRTNAVSRVLCALNSTRDVPSCFSRTRLGDDVPQGLFAAIQSLVNPGDEVILLEPAFDIYSAQVRVTSHGFPSVRLIHIQMACSAWVG